MIGHGSDDDGSGADFHEVADADVSENFCAGTDDDSVADRRMTFSGILAGSAERHALIHEHIIADFAGLTDDNSHAVIDETAAADGRTGVDLDSGQGSRDLRDHASESEPAPSVQAVGEAMEQHSVKSRITKENFQRAARRGVAAKHRIELFPDGGKHWVIIRMPDPAKSFNVLC